LLIELPALPWLAAAAQLARYDLTARERDVVHGLLRGHSNRRISASLGISPRTLEHYIAQLLDHFEVDATSQLVAMLIARGA